MNRARTAIVAWSRSMSVVPATKLFIDGKFVESKTKDWIDVHNPATNEV
jgi:malonate-semialdehyde dehydrogenase (acetylating)/methylmalonate-semialdehyde dehydrogenase